MSAFLAIACLPVLIVMPLSLPSPMGVAALMPTLGECRLGGAKVLLAGVAIWSLGTLLAPPAAKMGERNDIFIILLQLRAGRLRFGMLGHMLF